VRLSGPPMIITGHPAPSLHMWLIGQLRFVLGPSLQLRADLRVQLHRFDDFEVA